MNYNEFIFWNRKHSVNSSKNVFHNKEVPYEEIVKQIATGDFPLAEENGVENKFTTDKVTCYMNEGCMLVTQESEDEVILNHIENRGGGNDSKYKGAGRSLLNYVLSKTKGKTVRLTAEGGDEKLVNFYKSFGFKETGEECSYGVRMIKEPEQ